MPATLARAPAAPRDYAACSGCSLCLLVCPMWRRDHDPRLTPEGMAKALQHGATAADLAAPVSACSLCGACDPVCPEGIDLSGMVMELRFHLTTSRVPQTPRPAVLDDLEARLQQASQAEGTTPSSASSSTLLIPGPALRAEPALLARIEALLGLTLFDDDGADIVLALELGVDVPQARFQSFLASLKGRSIVAADGLLMRQLRRWLPGSKRMGLGAALSSRAAVRSNIAAGDLYVIEPRAFHGDHERMVTFYDRLQNDTGCTLSLDLQRIAIPATTPDMEYRMGRASADDGTQARWLLKGRKPDRIVVESLADRDIFKRVCEIPVVHLAELGVDPGMIKERPHAFG